MPGIVTKTVDGGLYEEEAEGVRELLRAAVYIQPPTGTQQVASPNTAGSAATATAGLETSKVSTGCCDANVKRKFAQRIAWSEWVEKHRTTAWVRAELQTMSIIDGDDEDGPLPIFTAEQLSAYRKRHRSPSPSPSAERKENADVMPQQRRQRTINDSRLFPCEFPFTDS